MASRDATRFERGLLRLFRDRTYWLRTLVRRPGRGKPPTFDREKKDRAIAELGRLLVKCAVKEHASREFRKVVGQKRQWHVIASKGVGFDEKRKSFDRWFAKNIHFPNCIYVLWAGRTCRYVGRTIRGKSRPQNHFDKLFFAGVRRIDIYSTSSPREVPKLECLATHRFKPTKTKYKPSQPRYTTKCPVCARLKAARSELQALFRLK